MTLHHFLRTLFVAALGVIGLAVATHARAEGGEGASVIAPENVSVETVQKASSSEAGAKENVAVAAPRGPFTTSTTKGGAKSAAAKLAVASAVGGSEEGGEAAVEQTSSIGPVQGGIRSQSQQADAIRAAGVKPLIARYASEQGLPVELADAVVRIESRYNAGARNGPNMGLTQINYRSAQSLGYRGNAAGLLDPETNLRYGLQYLAQAYKLAKGDTCGTILRYQAGHRAQTMTNASRVYCARVKTLMAAAD